MTRDRNYYRQLSPEALIAHVKAMTNPTELEIVLAETLEACLEGALEELRVFRVCESHTGD